MLGNGIYSVLKDKCEMTVTVRDEEEQKILEEAYPSVKNHTVRHLELEPVYNDYANKRGDPGDYLQTFLDGIGEVDCVINAIGVIIPHSLNNPALTFFINGAFPHILAGIFKNKLIHVTTDCVFNGQEGFPYDENSPPTPVDIYGLSKSLGEPRGCLTLRTSLIGREIQGFASLLEWFLRQKGKTIHGFTGHFWNGVTNKQFADICLQIMEDRDKFSDQGLFHVFSNTVSKYDMLIRFREKFNIDCEIIADNSKGLNRTLSTVCDLREKLDIASFEAAVEDL